MDFMNDKDFEISIEATLVCECHEGVEYFSRNLGGPVGPSKNYVNFKQLYQKYLADPFMSHVEVYMRGFSLWEENGNRWLVLHLPMDEEYTVMPQTYPWLREEHIDWLNSSLSKFVLLVWKIVNSLGVELRFLRDIFYSTQDTYFDTIDDC